MPDPVTGEALEDQVNDCRAELAALRAEYAVVRRWADRWKGLARKYGAYIDVLHVDAKADLTTLCHVTEHLSIPSWQDDNMECRQAALDRAEQALSGAFCSVEGKPHD